MPESGPLSASPATAWLTAAQAAEYLGLPSAAALRKRVERGQVPAHRFGRQLRFRRADLDALMAIRTAGEEATHDVAPGATRREGAGTPAPPVSGSDRVGSAAVSAVAGGELR